MEPRAGEIGLRQIGAGEIGIVEHRTAQVRAGKIGVSQSRMGKIRARQACGFEIGAL